MANTLLQKWILALPALIGGFFVPLSFMSISQSKMILILATVIVGGALFMIVRAREGYLHIPKSGLLFVASLVPLAYTVAALGATSVTSLFGDGAELDTLSAMVCAYALALLVAMVVRTEKDGNTVLLAFSFGGLFTGIVYAFQLVVPASTWFTLPITSLSAIGSWHEAALLVGLTFALSVVAYTRVDTSGARMWWGGVGVFSAFMLVILSSADAWFGVAGFLATILFARLYSVYRTHRSLSHSLRGEKWSLAILLIALLCGIFSATIHAALPAAIQVTNTEIRPSWQGTYEVGQNVFNKRETLLLGAGPNTFARQWGMYKPLSVNATQFWNADFPFGIGFVPTSTITVGLPGLIAWLAVFGMLVVALFRTIRSSTSLESPRALLLMIAIYLGVFLVVYVPGIGTVALFFVALGAYAALSAQHQWSFPLGKHSQKSPLTWLGVLTASALVLFLCWNTGRVLASNIVLNRTVTAYGATGSVMDAHAGIKRALALSPGNDRAHRSAIELGLIEFTQEAQKKNTDVAPLKAILEKTIQHGLAAVATDPRKYENWLTLAQFYRTLAGVGVEGAQNEARSAFEKALETRPRNPYPLISLAELDYAAGNASSTRARLQSALAIKPDLAIAHYMLSQLNLSENNFQGALDEAVATAQIAQQDPLAWFHVGSILYTGGDYVSAAQALERAVSLQKDYSDALFVLGLSYARLDRLPEAQEQLEKVLALNPGNKNVLEAIAEVQRQKRKK